MEINILAFGQIADITGNRSWKLNDVSSTDVLRQRMALEFPQLKEMNYLVAVDKTIIQGDAIIPDKATVALLPPFSGG